MFKKTIGITLVSVTLMGCQYAFGNVMRFEEPGASFAASNATHVTASTRRAGDVRQERPVMMAMQNTNLHESFTRFTSRTMSSSGRSQSNQDTNGEMGSGTSANAMLVVGLGIALISVIRRMGLRI